MLIKLSRATCRRVSIKLDVFYGWLTSDTGFARGGVPSEMVDVSMKWPAPSLDFIRHVGTPLKHGVFRRIWLASLLSNLGLMIQTVGAAWAMTQMTSSADMVALVQTAWMLPTMLSRFRRARSPTCMTAAA